jgi:hypothetical protein
LGKSDEERKASSDKHRKDATAKMCKLCRQTFMINARPPLMYQHVIAKHPELIDDFLQCFPEELLGWEPNDTKGEKAAAAAKIAAKPKKAKASTGDFDALLDVGLKKGKKK